MSAVCAATDFSRLPLDQFASGKTSRLGISLHSGTSGHSSGNSPSPVPSCQRYHRQAPVAASFGAGLRQTSDSRRTSSLGKAPRLLKLGPSAVPRINLSIRAGWAAELRFGGRGICMPKFFLAGLACRRPDGLSHMAYPSCGVNISYFESFVKSRGV